MKRCPECRKDYRDDSLIYCLDDGAALVQGSVTDEPPTAILSGDRVSSEELTRSINESGTTAHDTGAASSRPRLLSRLNGPLIVATLVLLTAAIFAYAYLNGKTGGGSQAMRLSFEPPAELVFNDKQPDFAVIAPDGQRIAFSATDASGKGMLYVRELSSSETKMLPGSENPLEPFWSPDSRSVAYGSNGKLKRSDLGGGNALVLCDAGRIVGGSWSKDGTIIFVPDYRMTLVQVYAQGGEPKPVVINVPEGEVERHRYPYFLPDGRRFLFFRDPDKGVWVGSLDSPEIVQIIPDNSPALYSKEGWLIFIRSDTLLAQRFDPNKLLLSGDALPIIADQRSWANSFRFSASDTGTLIWQGVWQRDYQLVWHDRSGKEIGVVEPPGTTAAGQDPRISPDGKKIAIKRSPPNTVWVVDLEKGNSVRITADFGQLPVWSPDGSRLVYSGSPGLVVKAATGLGEGETVLSTGAPFPYSWSPDGKYIIYMKRGVKTRLDIYAVSLEGERKEIQLLSSQFDEDSPALSPDGKWLAYGADDPGSYEIYAQAFVDGKLASDRKRVSNTGGRMPVWSRRGDELFFAGGDGHIMTTPVRTVGDQLEFGTPKALFKTRMFTRFGIVHEFDVSADGQRFLIGTLIGETRVPKPTVILNWTSLVTK